MVVSAGRRAIVLALLATGFKIVQKKNVSFLCNKEPSTRREPKVAQNSLN